jgi:DNA-binding HxlR family transcriptional regulator
MTRTSLDHHNCSYARTVDVIGDRWSLMILRDAFFGIRRFSQFKERLGITQAVLSARLSHLVDHELLVRKAVGEDGSREEYRLTNKGRALFPVVVTLMQWGDHWVHGEVGPPLLLFDATTGEALDQMAVTAAGSAISSQQIGLAAGPGATQQTRQLIERATGPA